MRSRTKTGLDAGFLYGIVGEDQYRNYRGIIVKIKKLIVDGFRSFGTRTIIEFSKENAFIGNNGSGKTSCLLAMNKMFSPNASERSITRNDFICVQKIRVFQVEN